MPPESHQIIHDSSSLEEFEDGGDASPSTSEAPKPICMVYTCPMFTNPDRTRLDEICVLCIQH